MAQKSLKDELPTDEELTRWRRIAIAQIQSHLHCIAAIDRIRKDNNEYEDTLRAANQMLREEENCMEVKRDDETRVD